MTDIQAHYQTGQRTLNKTDKTTHTPKHTQNVFTCAHTHTLIATTKYRPQEFQGRHRNLFRLFHLSGVQCLLTLLSSHENIQNLNHNIPQSTIITIITINETPNNLLTLPANCSHQLTDEIIGVTFESRERDVAGFNLHSQYIVRPSRAEND